MFRVMPSVFADLVDESHPISCASTLKFAVQFVPKIRIAAFLLWARGYKCYGVAKMWGIGYALCLP